ncbi:MAG: DUF389 domain-containing protein [Candidatus Limnocylindrales bacterium]
MPSIAELFHGRATTPEDLAWLSDKVRLDEPPVRDRYMRFFTLLVLSTVIAAGGLIGDSAAVIIGAMIVAPLMTPMMGAAFGIITGNGRATVVAVLTVSVGIVVTVVIAAVLASLVPAGVRITPEELARTSPRLLDLVVALAAGAAGAFAIGREDVSDALPGVAIAVSLVPPLAVVGITLAAGRNDLAGGAFLLFFTNFVAIVLAAVIVMVLMGYGAVARAITGRGARRAATAVIIVALLAVIVPLAGASYQVAVNDGLTNAAQTALKTWLAGTDYSILSVTASDGHITAAISGDGATPPFDLLLAELRRQAGRVTISVTAYPATTMQGTS